MGLGASPKVGLAAAWAAAARWRGLARGGVDPVSGRRRAARDAARADSPVATVAAAAFEARKAELKRDGEAGRWRSPLALHVLPKLGRVPVTDLGQVDVRNCLAPIWHARGETALLHKSGDGRSFPIPGQTYPATSMMGVPRAARPSRAATRPWNAATRRPKSRADRRCPRSLTPCVPVSARLRR